MCVCMYVCNGGQRKTYGSWFSPCGYQVSKPVSDMAVMSVPTKPYHQPNLPILDGFWLLSH